MNARNFVGFKLNGEEFDQLRALASREAVPVAQLARAFLRVGMVAYRKNLANLAGLMPVRLPRRVTSKIDRTASTTL